MTPELTAHLERAEFAVQSVKPMLARHQYPDDLRTVLVIGFITQVIEHQESMLLLISNEMRGSACVLARSIFESLYRGLWINRCATDDQVSQFVADDRMPVNMTQMASAIDAATNPEGFFTGLKARCWQGMCSYTHTGMLQLGRRFTGHEAQPAYTDAMMMEATTVVTTCVLLLVGDFFATRNHATERDEVGALIGTYGLTAQNPATRP